jgi:hypothetical protein
VKGECCCFGFHSKGRLPGCIRLCHTPEGASFFVFRVAFGIPQYATILYAIERYELPIWAEVSVLGIFEYKTTWQHVHTFCQFVLQRYM